MFDSKALEQFSAKGISVAKIEEQLSCFVEGFPFLDVMSSASVERGILEIPKEEQADYMNTWSEYLAGDNTIVKFVPASGAASRMFKMLYTFLASSNDTPMADNEKKFFDNIERFAFYGELDAACIKIEEKDIKTLIASGQYKKVASALLSSEGLNYGEMPKGLILFHKTADGMRTAMEEHLAEGAMYAKNSTGKVNVHFTVSPEHVGLFKKLVSEVQEAYERKYSVNYDVTFSVQKSSTDTIAVDLDNNPFVNDDDTILFRPGGHGALIENLNDIDADIIFLKNIDNVVPDSFKFSTVAYKKILAGLLISTQRTIFAYVELIDSGKYSQEQVHEMIYFLQNKLCVRNPEIKLLEDVELVLYIKKILQRPLRVCGMVRNLGEAGGGPFYAANEEGIVSLQILESTQIDISNIEKRALFENGTHFNPVDLVCAVKDYEGNKYNLTEYVDKKTAFLSEKSKDGRALKALELPGLWNGAMSNWNTLFVEVPIETFNPVKEVNDLLRSEHC